MNQIKVGKKIHPGSGRRKAPALPKGRFLDGDDRDRVREILGDLPRQRDLLIEHLHLIQDSEGCLPAGLLHGLAAEMRIPMSEVYEVASFYAHFDIVRDGEERPAPVTIRVCESLSCALSGAERLISELETNADADIRVLRAPCMGRCDLAPAAEVGHRHVDNCTSEKVLEVAGSGHLHPHIPEYKAFDAYRQAGGYAVLEACTSGKRAVDDVIGTLSDGGLRGLGGAGFPTGRKWSFVRAEAGPRLMAVNGDEGEPGTFKDRIFLESNPHQFLEGMLIGAWVVEAEEVFIYLRDEYPAAREILLKEIAAVEAAGLSKHTKIT
ncbi:MAG: NAD(P)H-dependent oxidoreductase subunit E, partial [Nisaea sp.]